jgi:hypothetical protein
VARTGFSEGVKHEARAVAADRHRLANTAAMADAMSDLIAAATKEGELTIIACRTIGALTARSSPTSKANTRS